MTALTLTLLTLPLALGSDPDRPPVTAVDQADPHRPTGSRSARPIHAEDFGSDVAQAWMDLLYDVVKVEAVTPPQASRVYGVAALALYETVVPGSAHNRSLAGQLNGLSPLPPPRAPVCTGRLRRMEPWRPRSAVSSRTLRPARATPSTISSACSPPASRRP